MEALRIPLLVAHRKETGYRLRCLFLPEIDATAERYESALNKLRQAIQRHFQGTRSERATLDERLWLTFAPPLRFELVPLGFDSGRRWIEGLFAAAHFSLGERRYACLPQLDGIVADLGDGSVPHAQRTERLAATIQRFFRERRQELGDAFDPLRHLASANDEFGELELSLHLINGRFPFEEESDLFAKMRGDDIGDGPAEMARVATDLNELYPDELGKAILRDTLVAEVEQAIYRADSSAFVLVGPRGAGKTALVHGAVRRHIDGQPGRQRTKLQKVWQLDPMRVISGMSIIGQWQRRMAVVMGHVQSRLRETHAIDKADHLYCDNLVALLSMGKSSQSSLTLADVLRPQLERRAFTLVGEATPEAWQKVQQRDRRFADLFRVIRVDAPARADAIRVVGWRRAELEKRHGCSIESAAMGELLKLERRFASDEVLPGSALRVLDRLAVRHAKQTVGRAEVMAAYLSDFHFRERLFSRHVGLAPSEAARHFAARLVGQPQARARLVDVVALVKSGLAAPGKPLSSLLFIGPTGVGKSEAAKLLADYLFADEGGLVRFDMNEYVDADALDRLIGDAQRPDGQLTSAVRQRRACVLLLDEIEKAHPAVHDLLLQLLGEGRLTDALGRTTDFSQCVVILTSNLGAAAAAAERRTGFTQQASDAAHTYREAVERFFRPEFLNRIDQVVSFTPLAREDIAGIARLQLERVLARDGFVRRLTFLNVAPEALDHLADLGRDESLGARALKRGIERALTGPIAQRIASSQPGDPMLLVVAFARGQLATRATLLRYASARPVPLPVDEGPSGYVRVRDEASVLHDSLVAALDTGPSDDVAFALRALQVRLDPLREVLERRCWDLAERRAPTVGRSSIAPLRREWRWYGRPMADMLEARQDIHEFFERLQAESASTRGVDAELVRWQLELGLLKRRADSLARRGIDRVCVDIAPLQAGDGAALVQAAWSDYAALLSQLDAHELASPAPGVRCFEGAGLAEVFGGERGVHLWYRGDDRPVPLAVHARPLSDGDEETPASTEIVRIRYEPARDGEQRRMTDLRSGRVRKFAEPLGEDDWRLLLWDAASTAQPGEEH